MRSDLVNGDEKNPRRKPTIKNFKTEGKAGIEPLRWNKACAAFPAGAVQMWSTLVNGDKIFIS